MSEEEENNTSFGACFIGPPGSGKTTCVKALKDMCDKLKRHCLIINLDPANEKLPYKPDFDLSTVINLKTVMKEEGLGPNGALLYCMESLAASAHDITKLLQPLITPNSYLLIDFPGQVELYTHSEAMRTFIQVFKEDLNAHLAAVNLVDIVVASTKEGLLGQSLMSLGTMLRLELPHINLLSKFDMAGEIELPYDPFNFQFDDFVAEGVPNKLHLEIVDLLNSFDLVSYSPFSIKDETAIMEVLQLIDKSVGCTWML